jgi:membrane protease YdiL (CAAX protease family)
MSAQNPMASSEPPYRAHHRREVALAAAIAAGGLALFAAIAARSGAPPLAALLASIVFMWVFVPCPALAVSRWAAGVRSWTWRAPLLRFATLVILAATGPAAYAAIQAMVPPGMREFLPWMEMAHLSALELAVLLAPAAWLGFSFSLGRRDWATAAFAFLAFAAVAIPLGFAIGFIRWGPRHLDPLRLTALAFKIYFLIALPEELVFRGLIQSALERRLPGTWRAPGSLVIASVVFGGAHLQHPPVPNLRYGLLAALAGLAYGFVWQRSRKITASALTHFAVDFAWVVLFAG